MSMRGNSYLVMLQLASQGRKEGKVSFWEAQDSLSEAKPSFNLPSGALG